MDSKDSTMDLELNVALNFIMSYLYNKMPRRRVDCFAESLERALRAKFDDHWYPETPSRGSAYRCVRVMGEIVDSVIEQSAQENGLVVEELKSYLPGELALWIDPGEVSYRMAERGALKILYSTRKSTSKDKKDTAADKTPMSTFNPNAQVFQPISSVTSTLSALSLSPTATPAAWCPGMSPAYPLPTYLPKTSSTPCFTVAEFAATKFGSSKLKMQLKRPTRISPTEFNPRFPRLESPVPRPRSLSPMDSQGLFRNSESPQYGSPFFSSAHTSPTGLSPQSPITLADMLHLSPEITSPPPSMWENGVRSGSPPSGKVTPVSPSAPEPHSSMSAGHFSKMMIAS